MVYTVYALIRPYQQRRLDEAGTSEEGRGVKSLARLGGLPHRAFVCKIAKLNTKSPLRGGGSKVWRLPA
jgi:hypothetical protein